MFKYSDLFQLFLISYNIDFALVGVWAEMESRFDISTGIFTKGLTFLYFGIAFIIFFSYEIITLKRQDHTRSRNIISNAMRKSADDEDEDRDEDGRVNRPVPPDPSSCQSLLMVTGWCELTCSSPPPSITDSIKSLHDRERLRWVFFLNWQQR